MALSSLQVKKVASVVFFGMIALFLSTLFYVGLAKARATVMGTGLVSPSAFPVHGASFPDGWKPFALHVEGEHGTFDHWHPQSVKVIFEYPDAGGQTYYLVSRKRPTGRSGTINALHKFDRYEFLGGQLETSEGVWDALEREVLEEDPSGVLVNVLHEAHAGNNRPLAYRNIAIKNGEHHTVFKTTITLAEWNQISTNASPETFGFRMVPLKALDPNHLAKNQWTPKSVKILRALWMTDDEDPS